MTVTALPHAFVDPSCCCSCNLNIPLGIDQGTGSAQPIQSDDEDDSKEPNCLLLEPDFQLMQALMESQQNFTISDPSMADNPIVYASQASSRFILNLKVGSEPRIPLMDLTCRYGYSQAPVTWSECQRFQLLLEPCT